GYDGHALEGGVGVFAGLGGPAESIGAGAEGLLHESGVVGQQGGGEKPAGLEDHALGQGDDLAFGRLGEGGSRGEDVGLRDFAGVEQGSEIVEHGHALGGVEVIAGQEFGEQGGIVARDVVARGVGIGGEIGGGSGGAGGAGPGGGVFPQEAFFFYALWRLGAHPDPGLPNPAGG